MDPAFLDPRFFRHFDPARWEDELCGDLAPALRVLLADPDLHIAAMGLENVKQPDLAVLLNRRPSDDRLAELEQLCAVNANLRLNFGSIVCFDHYHAVEWDEPPGPSPASPEPARVSLWRRLFGRRSAG